MENKMTSGEIAKKTGVSQKAIRLYDEKGLLKPTEYTEGNYRLYDKEALLVLEKIIALKQVGFSLEEIRENLNKDNGMNVQESLKHQIQIMQNKKYQLEKAIACIQKALERCTDKPDWDSIAEIMRNIQIDQKADERHFDAIRHSADDEDWYIKIYRSLGIEKNEKVLDLGCGYAKLWRNNWKEIPEGVTIDAVDLHGSWADDFWAYVEKQKSELADGTEIVLNWKDVEQGETWSELGDKAPYQRVIAHYLTGFLQNKELLFQRAAAVLAKDGVFCCNGAGVSSEYLFWKNVFEDLNLSADFITSKMKKKKAETEEFTGLLKKYFSRLEEIQLSSCSRYTNSEELVERAKDVFPNEKKFLTVHEGKIKAYFEEKITHAGEVCIEKSSAFWHCYQI